MVYLPRTDNKTEQKKTKQRRLYKNQSGQRFWFHGKEK